MKTQNLNNRKMIIKQSYLAAVKYLLTNKELNRENIKSLFNKQSIQTNKFILIIDTNKLL
jgi:hypothetical protein